MADFADEMKRLAASLAAVSQEVFLSVATEAFNSVVYGSPLTGSPGQPVADVNGGALRASWQLEFPTPTSALISTKSVYAPSNEDGIARPGGGPYMLRASIGGRFSVALTIAAIPKIVAEETARLMGRG